MVMTPKSTLCAAYHSNELIFYCRNHIGQTWVRYLTLKSLLHLICNRIKQVCWLNLSSWCFFSLSMIFLNYSICLFLYYRRSSSSQSQPWSWRGAHALSQFQAVHRREDQNPGRGKMHRMGWQIGVPQHRCQGPICFWHAGGGPMGLDRRRLRRLRSMHWG